MFECQGVPVGSIVPIGVAPWGGGAGGKSPHEGFKIGKIRKCRVFALVFLPSLTRDYML